MTTLIKGTSPARRLVDLVARTAKTRSWRDVNEARQAAVTLALKSDMRFGREDFNYFSTQWGSARWLNHETAYREACEHNNVSACQALEHTLKRPPFIFTEARLHVGSKLRWAGYSVEVTSFGSDHNGPFALFCAYKPGNESPRKVIKRFKVTRAELKAGEPKSDKPPPELLLRKFFRLFENDYWFRGTARAEGLKCGTLKAFWNTWTYRHEMMDLLARLDYPMTLKQALALDTVDKIREFIGDFDQNLRDRIETYVNAQLRERATTSTGKADGS